MAASWLLLLAQMTREGRHWAALFLISSLVEKLTRGRIMFMVYSTWSANSSLSSSIMTDSILIATSASSVSKVLMLTFFSPYTSLFSSNTFWMSLNREGTIWGRNTAKSFFITMHSLYHPVMR